MSRMLAACALFILVSTHCTAADPGLGSAAGVLVLRNGQVLRGVIVPVGDRYQITLPGGGEVRVPGSSVEMTCRDIAEAYAIKSLNAQRGSVGDQLDLAEWCLRHELFADAAEELKRAREREPQNARGLAVERRLKSLATKPATTEPAPIVPNLHVSSELLEQEMRDLPAGSVETFTTSVQPLIINRCAATGCHGAATKSDYRIFQPSLGQTITRRFTQRNLHSTLGMIDKQSPNDSKLLTVIRNPHGGQAKPIFSEREEGNLRLLEKWVEQVTRPKPSTPASLTERKASLLQTTSAPKVLSFTQDDTTHKKDGDSALENDGNANVENGKKPKTARGVNPREFSPRDPFDPEVFNRRFFGGEEKRDLQISPP